MRTVRKRQDLSGVTHAIPMGHGARNAGLTIAAAAVLWHLLSVLSPAWTSTVTEDRGRDYASYYYAVRVAAEGGDPYDKRQLNRAAQQEGVRRGVHPFLYAPPFLLTMTWALPLDLAGSYHLWFWLHELCAIVAAIVLWRWWRPLGDDVGLLVLLVVSLMTAVPNNHAMGQANFPGLALALAGLWQAERDREWLGGALMGAACMLKMSPALWVVWWLVRRRWKAAAGAVLCGAVLSVLVLPLAGPEVQWRFYTEILPTFGSGDYNGLAVPINLFGNHSVPNLVNDLLPGRGGLLSPAARAISTVVALGSLGALSVLFSQPDLDELMVAAQASAIGVLILLVPVYTYEHHLVFAIPAAVVAIVGVLRGRLSEGWTVPVGLAVAVLLFDLRQIRSLALALSDDGLSWLAGPLKELKFLALVALLVATATLGTRKES